MLIGSGLLYKYDDKKIGNDILIISEDCRVKNPKSSHLLAPFISLPKIIVRKINTSEKIKNNPENVL